MKDMELYDSFIRETTDLLGAPTQKWAYKERDAWKDNGESELVLLRDAAYELGGGANDAVNFTCVTSDSSLVPADEVLLYGPDMKEIKGDVPFARLVILGVKDIDVENKDATYAAIRNIEFVKYHVFPDGYMMRVSPESSREQIRVSKKAIKKGISFYKVGCDFIKQYKKNPNITNVRVIFITKNVDFKTLHDTAKKIDDDHEHHPRGHARGSRLRELQLQARVRRGRGPQGAPLRQGRQEDAEGIISAVHTRTAPQVSCGVVFLRLVI